MRAAVAIPLLALVALPSTHWAGSAWADEGSGGEGGGGGEGSKSEESKKTGEKEGEKELHGSQVASSQWLPIFLGAGAGVIVGALSGQAFDSAQPAVIGPVVGGVLGGFTGGAAGAWLIRGLREQDTSVAGTLTGLGLGAGIGAILFTNVEPNGRALETVGKWGALVVLPLMGAFAGHRLAVVWARPAKKDDKAAAPAAFFRPSVTPLFGPAGVTNGTTGVTFGVDGVF